MTGDASLTARVLKPLAVLEPGSPLVLAAAARLRYQAGDNAGAQALVSGSPDATVTFELAVGRPERALASLEAAPDPALLKRVAGALREQGHVSAAAAAIDRAAALPNAEQDVLDECDRLQGELCVLGGAWRVPARVQQSYVGRAGRVLHVHGRSRPFANSGYTVRSHYVLMGQRAAGLDAIGVTQLGFPDRDGRPYEEVDGVPYHRLGPGEATPRRADDRLSANLEELDALVGQLRPAVLHPASDHLNAQSALAVRERRNVPVVYEVRGFWEETWLASRPDELVAMKADNYLKRRAVETDCMLRADHVVTLAEVMRDEIVSRGVAPERISVVPNAVDPAAMHTAPRDPALARRLGLDDADLILGYISTFSAYEGVEHLLEATARLRERGHRAKVLLVGDGPARARLELIAAELRLGNAAVFAGRAPHDAIAAYYGLIDVFVVPRVGRRVCRMVTPLKPYEAMATRTPVVVSDLEALQEVIGDGRYGLSFRAEDAAHLADVVEPLMGDTERRRALADAAYDWIMTERTWASNAMRYHRIYESLDVL